MGNSEFTARDASVDLLILKIITRIAVITRVYIFKQKNKKFNFSHLKRMMTPTRIDTGEYMETLESEVISGIICRFATPLK